MFYALIKIYARLVIKLFCKKIVVNKPEILHQKGPILFAANHPNSFLDGIILTTLLDAPLYSLARGDAFKNKTVSGVLRKLKLLPVYRTSEGPQNLNNNYISFAACHAAFAKEAAVLIFSEACCVNEWHLRPLRKGTARLALSSWQQGINVPVIPVGFNYDCFKKFGKTVHINFGSPILHQEIDGDMSAGQQLNLFNKTLTTQLQSLVYEAADAGKAKSYFPFSNSTTTALLMLPGMIGWLLHAPLFYSCRFITAQPFKNSDHYDSVLIGLLLVAYPFYILLLVIILWFLSGPISLVSILILPFTAWCWLQVKHLFDTSPS